MVLASASPRRSDLLRQIGLEFTIAPTDVDETPRSGEDPVSYVRRLAIDKAHAAPDDPRSVVIAADTTVDVDGQILAKPDDEADARRMLKLLSGRVHRVHTGVAVRYDGRTAVDVETTFVKLLPITDEMLEHYIATGEPMGKAGAYAIQGQAAAFIDGVQGSITNVIGLPMRLLTRLMTAVGAPLADLVGGVIEVP